VIRPGGFCARLVGAHFGGGVGDRRRFGGRIHPKGRDLVAILILGRALARSDCTNRDLVRNLSLNVNDFWPVAIGFDWLLPTTPRSSRIFLKLHAFLVRSDFLFPL
jgi:hypothetical protein